MTPSKNLGQGFEARVRPQEGQGKAMEKPHVHVVDADGEVKISLEDFAVLKVWAMKPTQVKKAVALVMANHEMLMEVWNGSRPTAR